ncbi:hypothetical protein SAMN06297468_2313 [Altererythrobacter xiamenensis]|uniref:DUF1269 domain-containing protein n=1 Tax=Altererythrobacter xiamenensis TaxID=1316679 RepID=A0A1Y6FFL7_9SPHN|nr:hypothetical protein [Altererythrobacter xiamenensis]SMQ73758.1 hypothetical protein SAMN06297468_2313 [Altererythrobacter xiamenensis]
MKHDRILEPAYVIKAEELVSINYLPADHPKPREVEWINRGTDQVLRPTTADQLLRTLYQPTTTPSIKKLHDSAGLRVKFRSERERDKFAADFAEARKREVVAKDHVLTALFDGREAAEEAINDLSIAGVPEDAMSMLCRSNQFLEAEKSWPEGHGTASVASAIAGGGFAGALLGVGILFVPGVGPVAAAGAIASSALTSVASVSGIIGATGGAIAKMLTDHDVDGVSAAQYDALIRRGKIFVSVDTHETDIERDKIREIFRRHKGRDAAESAE